MNGHGDVMKTSISIKNKYSTIVLPLLWVVIDYLAVLLAEQLSFFLRNALITNSALHISWLSFHVIGPAIFILFMQVQSLYTRRMQFWRIISRIFKANLYAVGVMIFLMYVLETASHTSRLFIGFICLLLSCIIPLCQPQTIELSPYAAASGPHHGGRKDGCYCAEIFQERFRSCL